MSLAVDAQTLELTKRYTDRFAEEALVVRPGR